MTEVKVRMSNEGAFPVNEELAGLVPMAIESEQAVLTQDIKANGQRDPIVLWKGEVVDGRCRQLALTTLGNHILYKELDSNLTENEVRVFVKSVNTRRNLTTTQKIMTACRESLRPSNGKSVGAIAKEWGIGYVILNNARYIAKHKPELVDPLFNGNTVEITDKHGNKVHTNKVTAVYSWLKKNEELVKEDTTYGWKPDANIKTQAGKEWYYETMANCGCQDNVIVSMLMTELANYKFVESGKKQKEKEEQGISLTLQT